MSSNKEKIFEFVDNIIKQPLKDEVKATKIVDFVLNLDISKSYKSTSLTNIKKYLINNNSFSNPDNYKLVQAPTEFYIELHNITTENRNNKQTKTLNKNDIDILFNLKYSDNPWKLYIWILFVTGRRLLEMSNNTIEKIAIDKIKLGYISKQKNIPDNNIVYLLVPYDDFITVYNKFIQMKKDNPILNNYSYYEKAVNRVLLKLKLSVDKISSHYLRKAYLTYMLDVKKFRPDLLPAIRTKMLLNHNNEATSTYYNGSVKFQGVDNDIVKNNEKYNCMKISDIKKLLDESNIKYKSKMKKNELIALIPV